MPTAITKQQQGQPVIFYFSEEAMASIEATRQDQGFEDLADVIGNALALKRTIDTAFSAGYTKLIVAEPDCEHTRIINYKPGPR